MSIFLIAGLSGLAFTIFYKRYYNSDKPINNIDISLLDTIEELDISSKNLTLIPSKLCFSKKLERLYVNIKQIEKTSNEILLELINNKVQIIIRDKTQIL